jgi:hypothetical protein
MAGLESQAAKSSRRHLSILARLAAFADDAAGPVFLFFFATIHLATLAVFMKMKPEMDGGYA